MMFFTVKNQFPESKQDAWQNVKNRVLIHCLGLRTRDETALVRKEIISLFMLISVSSIRTQGP